MRRLRGCLAAVGAVALCLAALAGGIWYRVEVALTEVLTDVSPDGAYELTIDRVGEPDWPFGATHCRFTLHGEGRQILGRAFSIQDDGAVARAEEILRETLEESGQNKPSTQAFAVLADFSSAFLDGVPRYVVILRAVNASGEGTIHVRRLPQDVLERAAERIMKETPRVYRVVYDLSAVPPAHVEWE